MMQQISGAAFRKRSLHPLAGITVLQVLAELETSPDARAAIETAEALVRVGGTPLVAAGGGSLVSELQARGGIFIRLPTQSLIPFDPVFALGRLVGLIRAEAIDIVYARSRLSAWFALAAARLTQTAFVTSFPASLETGNALVSRFSSVMARGDRILVDSAYAARIVETLHPAARGRIHVIGPGFDHSAFAVDRIPTARVRDIRQRWNSPPDEPVVLFLAELDPSEAQTFLGATARSLRARGLRNPRLVHIEPGSRSRCCTLDPTGESPHALPPCDDLPAALRAASVVAVPTGRAEAIHRLAVGAQTMGMPVIVVDDGALGETVLAPPDSTDSLRTGWRIPCADPTALAEAIEAALGLGASARDRLSLRARAHVDQHFSIEKMRAETLRAFVALRGAEDDA